MTQTIVTVAVFIFALAMLPLGIRWFQHRMPGGMLGGPSSKVVSTIAVGPQQRVVTVEVGPEDARVWLILGVTPQNVSCLHTMTPARRTASAGVVPFPTPGVADAGGGK